MSQSNQRLVSLDSLRGIAATMVICSHINLEYFKGGELTPFKNTPLHILHDGEAAVVFFFVLSGFVLAYKYLKDEAKGLQKLSLWSFIVARIFRIYPVFWAVLVLSALAATNLYHGYTTIPERSWTCWWWNHPFNPGGFLRQLSLLYDQSFVQAIIGNNIGDVYIPQAWSLQVELMLSVLVPLMIILVVHRPMWLVFFTVIMMVFFFPPVFIMHFAMGVLLAKHLEQVKNFFNNKRRWGKYLILLLGVLMCSYRYSVAPYFGTKSVLQIILFSSYSINFIIGVGAVIIISTALNSSSFEKALNIPLLRLLGKTSYGIYLCHTIVLVVYTPMFIHWLNNVGITNTGIIIFSAVIFTIAASVLLAYALHYLVELRFIALGRRVSSWVQKVII